MFGWTSDLKATQMPAKTARPNPRLMSSQPPLNASLLGGTTPATTPQPSRMRKVVPRIFEIKAPR